MCQIKQSSLLFLSHLNQMLIHTAGKQTLPRFTLRRTTEHQDLCCPHFLSVPKLSKCAISARHLCPQPFLGASHRGLLGLKEKAFYLLVRFGLKARHLPHHMPHSPKHLKELKCWSLPEITQHCYPAEVLLEQGHMSSHSGMPLSGPGQGGEGDGVSG